MPARQGRSRRGVAAPRRPTRTSPDGHRCRQACAWGPATHRYPFTAPAVSPATMRRWKNSTKMMIGMVTITAAAAMFPVGAVNCDSPVKNARAAGTVRALFEDVSVIANRKFVPAEDEDE